MAPPPKFEAKRLPAEPHPGPPPLPQQVIIQRLAANEDAAKRIYDTYDCTQAIRLEELDPPGGKFTVTGEIYSHPDGGRFWRPTKPVQSNLQNSRYSLQQVRAMANVPLFFLTSDEIGHYDFLYAGQNKLDELNTYVFQVKPRQLSRTRTFFDGVIYVDDHDLAIVESFGKFVTEVPAEKALPFEMFDVYRENFQDKYWLPTYLTSDDYINTEESVHVHLRLVVRSSDCKLESGAPVPVPPPSLPKP